jgi:hypothetical protein
MCIHIHAPQPSSKSITTKHCPDCKTTSRFIGFFTEWYGFNQTCLRCGRKWMDGEWMDLPFIRQARQNNIKNAKTKYRALG